MNATTSTRCIRGEDYCPIPDILRFHQQIMTSEKALRYALDDHRLKFPLP